MDGQWLEEYCSSRDGHLRLCETSGVLTTPLASDNVPAGLATDKVFDPVQVTIGGQPAAITDAGTSEGYIGGLT
jgi:uncharacterized protein (TIGR03437 family)